MILCLEHTLNYNYVTMQTNRRITLDVTRHFTYYICFTNPRLFWCVAVSRLDRFIFGHHKSRLRDQYVQNGNIAVITSSSPKIETYNTIKNVFNFELYLQCANNVSHIFALTQLRVSSHNIFIETGRYSNVARNMRFCTKCITHVCYWEWVPFSTGLSFLLWS
jgi:hypothetical protein